MSVAWAALAGYSQSMSRPSKPRSASRATLLLANVARPEVVEAMDAKFGE
jgi:hypothetical protein